ncbi:LytR family transcriptional regulator [Cellulomonas denverensis]|uniref:LytR family transcriptional regulator n=2 Tax=Cellulomonas denverensis TaxID=264297 RepID=A0A7X6KUF3_9CELL|nr:LCP family protein [Cellulomonas denverensis]NKY22501.1 LytR family transcriptional regulator [Cellulomonas denverensis]
MPPADGARRTGAGQARPSSDSAEARTPRRPAPGEPAAIPPRSGATRDPGRPGARTSARAGGSAVPVAAAPGRTSGSSGSAADDPADGGTRVMPAAAGRRSTPAGPGRPGQGRTTTGTPARPEPADVAPRAPRRRTGRRIALTLVLLLILVIAWPVGLAVWANGKIQHVDALSGAANTPGETYLLTGSDSREDGAIEDPDTVGARTDTILLLHVPESGPSALISLPRDTYVDIPGFQAGKLNAAFSWGGAPLLVETVEELTGLTVDHYVEIGFAGVEGVVDAVGGVELCLDDSVLTFPVQDTNSGLFWDAPGCKTVDGVTALAFARMRYSDPTGDIGRGQRQRQLISAVTHAVATPATVLNPGRQVSLVNAGTAALTTSEGTDIVDMAKLALAFRSAGGEGGITGTPPIADLDYRPGGVGSTVLLDPDQTPTFFAQIRDGELEPGVYGGVPTS